MQAYLVSLWKFNEGVGITAYDSAGKNNGTINGAKWTTSQFGGALSFNGNGDYVNCGNDKSLNIDGEITVAAWIYPRSNFWGGIIDKGDNTAGHDDYGLWFNNGKIEFSFNWPERWNVYPNGDRFIGSTAVALNRWSHFAGTWDGNKVRLYVNGKLDSEFNWTQGIKSSNASVYIGVNPGGQEEYFNGIIDEVAIYKRALSAEQIQQLYRNNPKGSRNEM